MWISGTFKSLPILAVILIVQVSHSSQFVQWNKSMRKTSKVDGILQPLLKTDALQGRINLKNGVHSLLQPKSNAGTINLRISPAAKGHPLIPVKAAVSRAHPLKHSYKKRKPNYRHKRQVDSFTPLGSVGSSQQYQQFSQQSVYQPAQYFTGQQTQQRYQPAQRFSSNQQQNYQNNPYVQTYNQQNQFANQQWNSQRNQYPQTNNQQPVYQQTRFNQQAQQAVYQPAQTYNQQPVYQTAQAFNQQPVYQQPAPQQPVYQQPAPQPNPQQPVYQTNQRQVFSRQQLANSVYQPPSNAINYQPQPLPQRRWPQPTPAPAPKPVAQPVAPRRRPKKNRRRNRKRNKNIENDEEQPKRRRPNRRRQSRNRNNRRYPVTTPKPTWNQYPATQRSVWQPATQRPVWQQPAAQRAVWQQPATQAPVWRQPATAAPVWRQHAAPVWQQPVTPAPVWRQPATAAPVWRQPATAAPAWRQPTTPAPAFNWFSNWFAPETARQPSAHHSRRHGLCYCYSLAVSCPSDMTPVYPFEDCESGEYACCSGDA